MPRYYVEKENKWNIFSTIVDDFLYTDFLDFEELKALVVGEVVVQKIQELDTLKTDKPILNRMTYEEAVENIEIAKENEQ